MVGIENEKRQKKAMLGMKIIAMVVLHSARTQVNFIPVESDRFAEYIGTSMEKV